MMPLQISPGQLREFLRIDTQRLRMWYQAGIFGDAAKTTGRGHPRKYSMTDVVTARVVQEILDLTKSRSLKIVAIRDLVKEIPPVIAETLSTNGFRVLKRDGTENEVRWFIIWWDRRISDWRGTIALGGKNHSAPAPFNKQHETLPQAFIAIPLWRIIEEAQHYFQVEE